MKDIDNLQQKGYKAKSTAPGSHRMQVRYAIGIDPGVNTGIAIWDKQKKAFEQVTCMKIHTAMQLLLDRLQMSSAILVRLEDARLRTWFGKAGKEQLQGAGSIKRDCGIWQDFLEEKGIPFQLVPPKANKTKVTRAWFAAASGWQGKTNNHARDAGMLVLNF